MKIGHRYDYLSDFFGSRIVMNNVESISYQFQDNRVYCVIIMNDGLIHKTHGVNHKNLELAMKMALFCGLSMMESSKLDISRGIKNLPSADDNAYNTPSTQNEKNLN